MVKTKTKNSKSKKGSSKKLISLGQMGLFKKVLFLCILVSAFVLGLFVYSSFASSGQPANPHPYKPNSKTVYKVAPGAKQAVQFVTNYTGTTKSGVLMQVAYRLKGSPTAAPWTVLASNPNLQIKGPNDLQVNINPGYATSAYMDQNGLNCGMGYGKNPPKDCYTSWTNSRQTGTAAFENTNVYFPTVSLPIGGYQWITRTYIISSKQYSKWSKPVSFSVQDSTATPPSILAPIIKILAPSSKTNLYIYTAGVDYHKVSDLQKKYKPTFTMDVESSKSPYYINVNNSYLTLSRNGWTNSRVRSIVMGTSAANYDLGVLEGFTKSGGKLSNGGTLLIVCSRGHHRSVTLAWELSNYLNTGSRKGKWHVVVNNLDAQRTH